MIQEWLNETLGVLSSDLEMDLHGKEISEEELLLAIAARVAELMDQEPGLLFSYMYRMDISEANLNKAIHTPSDDPIAYRLAELILKRQKARVLTKQKYRTDTDLEESEW